MKYENEFGIRLNEHGVTDVDYYVARAHKERSEAIGRGFKAFKAWLLRVVKRTGLPSQEQSERPKQVVQSGWPWVDMILQGTPNRKAGHV